MSSRNRWKPLGGEHRRYLSEEIARYLPVASQGPRAPWAGRIIDSLFWFWTADGMDERGHVGRDKLKYSFDFLWHSQEACGLSRSECAAGCAVARAKDLRHEHAVPKDVILERLLGDPPLGADGIMALLEAKCFAVILTKAENDRLNGLFKNSMPEPWHIDDPDADPFARYKHESVGLYAKLHPPRLAAPRP